jgi:hypothetical protein
MVIPLIQMSFLPVLDCLMRAPLDAGEALFAMVEPKGSAIRHLDIRRGTEFLTDAAGIAFLVGMERFVHVCNMPNRHTVQPGEEDILPEGAFFYRERLPF